SPATASAGCQNSGMGRKGRRWWPFGVIAAIAAGALLLLVTVWQSPHRSDLIAYWGLVATASTVAAGWFARFETHTWLGGAAVLPLAWLATSLLLLSATSSGNDDGSFVP